MKVFELVLTGDNKKNTKNTVIQRKCKKYRTFFKYIYIYKLLTYIYIYILYIKYIYININLLRGYLMQHD